MQNRHRATTAKRQRFDSKRPETTDKESTAKSRVLEAAAPKQSLVGRATEILTVIRLPDSEGLRKYIKEEKLESVTADDVRQKPFCLEFSPDLKGNLQPAEVILKIDSPNFRPRTQSKKLKVPPKHDSEVCTFLLTPLKVGELVANLELLVGDQVVVSRSIRTRAEPEGSSVSSAKVVVCLPLVLLVGGDILLNQADDSAHSVWRGSTFSGSSMSLPTPVPPPVPTSIEPSSARPTPKPTSLTGRIGAALGVLVFIAIAAFLYGHRQYGPKVVVKPPDKTQQDAKDHGQISPPDKTLKAQRSRSGTDAEVVKPPPPLHSLAPDKTQQDVKQNDDEKLREELEELERNMQAARSKSSTDVSMANY